MSTRFIFVAIAASCLALILASCSGPAAPATAPSASLDSSREADASLFKDTIGSIAELEGWDPIPIRGYGVVIGLADTGSRECPKQILEIIRGGFRGRRRSDGKPILGDVSLRNLINSSATAVVAVEGLIPAAAAAGDRIDLDISALPNTQTTSLAGGELLVSELSIEVISSSGTPVRKRPMVLAGYPEPAPVFINPFIGGDPVDRPVWLRSGRIIGGGTVLHSRSLRLVLRIPGGSYRLIRQISERLNFRFPTLPGQPPTAEGESRTTIKLMTPREYHGRARHFLMLVLQTYLFNDPVSIAGWSERLIDGLSNPDFQASRITAALEAIGNSNVPALRKAYRSSPSPRVRYYAASTAALLGDDQAIPTLTEIAADNSSPYQLLAVSALGQFPDAYRSNQALRPLLDTENALVRIRAYEYLAKNGDPSVVPVSMTAPAEFSLDVVRSKAQPLIYVQTMKQPRIVLFGGPLNCEGQVFYLSRDKLLTITSAQPSSTTDVPPELGSAEPARSSAATAEKLSLLRCTPTTGEIGLELQTSRDLVSLIKALGSDVEPDFQGVHHGLGLDYSQTVAALYGLWRSKSIRAGFVLQQSDIARAIVEQPSEPVREPPEPAVP
ncbi:MAG: hypothetical protein GWP14_07515 [Actinobacteria bacterium]|nr:hypothetical protein [Actinomycetota bacterium]